jgi:hypothetical protein
MGISKCQSPGCEHPATWACIPENERSPDIGEMAVCDEHVVTVGLTYQATAEKPEYWRVRSL